MKQKLINNSDNEPTEASAVVTCVESSMKEGIMSRKAGRNDSKRCIGMIDV